MYISKQLHAEKSSTMGKRRKRKIEKCLKCHENKFLILARRWGNGREKKHNKNGKESRWRTHRWNWWRHKRIEAVEREHWNGMERKTRRKSEFKRNGNVCDEMRFTAKSLSNKLWKLRWQFLAERWYVKYIRRRRRCRYCTYVLIGVNAVCHLFDCFTKRFFQEMENQKQSEKIQTDGTKNGRGERDNAERNECNKCIRAEVEKCTTEIYVFLMFFLSFFHTHHACPESFPDRWLAFYRHLGSKKNSIRNECSKLKSGNEKLCARNIESQS